MQSADTTPEAREVQLAIWRAMSGEQRLLMALAMSDDARRIALAGIAHRQPGLSAAELASELARSLRS